MAENLQERLYQRLREDLLAGRFQPGERLKIRDLANQWGTSPMPVRAALQRLVAEGALEGEAQRSLRVPLMTRERFLQILQVRLSLEGLAAESASGLDEQALEGLEGCLRRMEDALRRREVQAYLEANSEFHLTLYRACGAGAAASHRDALAGRAVLQPAVHRGRPVPTPERFPRGRPGGTAPWRRPGRARLSNRTWPISASTC